MAHSLAGKTPLEVFATFRAFEYSRSQPDLDGGRVMILHRGAVRQPQVITSGGRTLVPDPGSCQLICGLRAPRDLCQFLEQSCSSRLCSRLSTFSSGVCRRLRLEIPRYFE